ncbi:hypothetical protein FC35_GL000790 [Limosilactobacillus coleohominis DSM 14060]|nr:hypothetical protein FC35_GL000790 [Limosilactobacillus coleohominis DSM 14060]
MISIITVCYWILKSLIKKGIHDILEPFTKAIDKLTRATDENTRQQRKANERLERGDKKFIKLEERTQDHERRITRLEDRNDEKQ